MTSRQEGGFTLIEITIAVFILAISLVTLLGLESAVLQRSIADKNRVDAMLVSRRVLAAIESDPEPIGNQEISGSAAEILGKFVELSDEEAQTLRADLQATLKVEDWSIPESEGAMKRITLSLFWSGQTNDGFTVLYFIPNEEEQLDDVEPVDEESRGG